MMQSVVLDGNPLNEDEDMRLLTYVVLDGNPPDEVILALMDLVIQLGYDPANVNVAEELIKKKNADIAALKKQLKLPATEDSLAKEISETEAEKVDMLKLILEQSTQMKQKETKMEKWIKESKKTIKQVSPLEALRMTNIPTAIAATTNK